VLVITNKSFPPEQMKTKFPQTSLMEPGIVNTYEMRHTMDHSCRLGNIQFKAVLVMLAKFKKDIKKLLSESDQ
jgi:hypothetical protein